MNNRKSRGFTLIELMMVVAILGILAAIAIPAYGNYIRNAERSDGMTALMEVRMAQERFRANNPSYTATIGALTGVQSTSPEGLYNLAVTAATATSFTATATKSGGRTDTACATLTLTYAAGEVTRGPVGCWRN